MSSFATREKNLVLEKEADGLMKKAHKFISPSLLDFRLKPDWEAASPLLERAAVIYKQAGKLEKAIEACERASTAQEKQASLWHAAKHIETCAELSKLLKNTPDVVKYWKMAGNLYVEAGKATTGADSMAKGARSLEETSPDDAMVLYYDALDIYESENKEANAADIFRWAISLLIRQEKWADAVEMQMRFGQACDKVGARNSQMKAYLGAVVTWLYAQDAKQAWQTYQDALAIDSFMSSDEAYAADALFTAYRNQSEEEIKATIKTKHVFKNLDNQVGRLATKLPTGKLKRMARSLDKVMGSPEEDEEAYEDGEEPRNEDDELL